MFKISKIDSGCLTINSLWPCRIQDIAILFSVIIILLMMFNTYVFQVGLVFLLLERFRALLIISALYLTLSICFHCWVLVGNITGTYMPTQFKWNSCIIMCSQVQYWPPSIPNGQSWSCLFSFRTWDGWIQIDLFGQMAFCPFLFSKEQVNGELCFTS